LKNIKITGVIPASCRVQGDIDFSGGVWVDGEIVGNLRAHGPNTAQSMVVVNGNASVVGDIEADYVVVYGRVSGSIRAKESLEVGANAEISNGDIAYKNIMVVEGALLSGKMILMGAQNKKPKAVPSPKDQRVKLVNQVA
jgi:cytoskeletal protein CcmA (bactofilin family)